MPQRSVVPATYTRALTTTRAKAGNTIRVPFYDALAYFVAESLNT
jgi:hypothetical protein